MRLAGWDRTEVGSFPLFVEPHRSVVVNVLAPGAVRVAATDGDVISPQAALIEVVVDPPSEPLYFYPPDAVRLGTLLVDALPVVEEHDHQAVAQ